MTEFFRFPHTHHLIWLGDGEPRGDKVLPAHEVEVMLQHELIIEEKLDGANLGISLDNAGELQAQNRGSYLERPFNGQFSRLNSWIGQYEFALPDWFLLFDVYDRSEGKFWRVARRNAFAQLLGLALVPELGRGQFTRKSLTQFLEQATSCYRAGQVEGIVLRLDSPLWNEERAKFVNKGFVQAIEEHWRSRTMQWNQVAP